MELPASSLPPQLPQLPLLPGTGEKPVGKTYTVKAGDCLWSIAQSQLGNGSRYPELYNANQELIDAKNKGTGYPKYTIYSGQVLAIP